MSGQSDKTLFPPDAARRQRSRGGNVPIASLAILIVVAALCGGGGVRYGLLNLCVQMTALFAMAINRDAVLGFWAGAPASLRIGAALTISLPLLQLVPLPPSFWTQLPGRDLVVQSLELTGQVGWRPLSVDPIRTLVAATGLIAPVAILEIGWRIERSRLFALAWLVVGLAVAQLFVGMPQLLNPQSGASLYDVASQNGALRGLFANRNSTGLFLVIALALTVSIPLPGRHRAHLPVRVMTALLLIIAIILTRSRSAFVLMAIPILLALSQAFIWWRGSKTAKISGANTSTSRWAIGIAALGLLLSAMALATSSGRISDTLERFDASSDARAYIWEDAAYSASRYAPIGAGMGTFDEVFQIDESLEHLTDRRAGRAHNDYIELTIEAGVLGLGLMALWLSLIGWWAWRSRGSDHRFAAFGATAALLAIALQSAVDYPLRNQTMLVTVAFLIVVLGQCAVNSERAK